MPREDADLNPPPRAEAGKLAKSRGSSRHSFPPGGLVAASFDAYDAAPLLTAQIRPGVIMFAGAGGNVTAVAGSTGYTVVDTGFASRVGEIAQGIAAALGQPPRWLINTHWHFDHTDGNADFAAAGATILAHANCRARLANDQHVPSLSWRISASPRTTWPTLVFDRPVTLDIGTDELRLLPQAPAHTDGDVAVLLSSANVLVTGDLFTNGSYPVIDESSGGSLRGMIDAVDTLLPMMDAETTVVPGHGAAADRASLIGFRDMLRRIEESILALIEAQLEVQQIMAARPTSEFDPLWGRGYVTGAHFTRMALAGMGLVETVASTSSPAA